MGLTGDGISAPLKKPERPMIPISNILADISKEIIIHAWIFPFRRGKHEKKSSGSRTMRFE